MGDYKGDVGEEASRGRFQGLDENSLLVVSLSLFQPLLFLSFNFSFWSFSLSFVFLLS